MSEFINDEFGHRDVIKIEKSPLSKNKCDLSILEGKRWKIKASSRGKEMMVTLTNGLEKHSIKIGFAKIGFLDHCKIENIDRSLHKKGGNMFDRNAMLRFYTEDYVYFISDFSRYVIWRYSDEWDTRRSPDIALQHNDWRDHLYKHRNIKYFEKPIFEIMNDQRFFNGLGNFTRTEILYRATFSPFTPFKEILENDKTRNEFFILCRSCLEEIYMFGGLQFQHWKNPYGVSPETFQKWQQAYRQWKCLFTRDKEGREFWFHSQWESHFKLYKTHLKWK